VSVTGERGEKEGKREEKEGEDQEQRVHILFLFSACVKLIITSTVKITRKGNMKSTQPLKQRGAKYYCRTLIVLLQYNYAVREKGTTTVPYVQVL
jgi:hypothetical protein